MTRSVKKFCLRRVFTLLLSILNLWPLTLFSPTDSGFFIVLLKVFFIEDHIYTKNYVNRTTLREVLRFLSQNVSKISLLRTITINSKKKSDLPTQLCRPMKSETHIFFWPNNDYFTLKIARHISKSKLALYVYYQNNMSHVKMECYIACPISE